MELAGETYELAGSRLVADPAAFFYVFQPAAPEVREPPLFVVSGGGPGAGMSFLLAHGLGPERLVEVDGQLTLEPNPWRLDRWGHVLYVDARGAGFSYQRVSDPSDEAARAASFSVGNYNVYRDAADVLRVACAVIAARPELARAKLAFVTESYGATRITALLHQLLFREPAVFRSPALDAALGTTLEAALGPGPHAPPVIAEHVRAFVALQPALGGLREDRLSAELLQEPGSELDTIAAETGIPFVRCTPPCDAYESIGRYLTLTHRSRYDYTAPETWLDEHIARVSAASTRLDALARLTGAGPEALGAALRARGSGAFRLGAREESWAGDGALTQELGALSPWDRYFLPLSEAALATYHGDAADALAASPDHDGFGADFVEVAALVPTFVSQADRDLVTYGRGFVPLLASYSETVARVTQQADTVRLELRNGGAATVTAKAYRGCSHAVLADCGDEVGADLEAFLGGL